MIEKVQTRPADYPRSATRIASNLTPGISRSLMSTMSVGLKDAVDRMKPLFTDKCPFVSPPNIKEKIQWVRPKLVCEIEYAELTADEQLRQTTFLGWRDDKSPEDIVLEVH